MDQKCTPETRWAGAGQRSAMQSAGKVKGEGKELAGHTLQGTSSLDTLCRGT